MVISMHCIHVWMSACYSTVVLIHAGYTVIIYSNEIFTDHLRQFLCRTACTWPLVRGLAVARYCHTQNKIPSHSQNYSLPSVKQSWCSIWNMERECFSERSHKMNDSWWRIQTVMSHIFSPEIQHGRPVFFSCATLHKKNVVQTSTILDVNITGFKVHRIQMRLFHR